MDDPQRQIKRMRLEKNYLLSRLDNVDAEISQLTDSVNRAMDTILPKVKYHFAHQATVGSNSIVVETALVNAEAVVSLFRAAKDGDVEAIYCLLCRDDVDFKQRNEECDSALHVAAKAGHDPAVTLLLGNIAVDILGNRGRTALHCASEGGHLTVVRRLILTGADVDAKDGVGDIPIILAAKEGHVNVVKHLKKENACLDLVDADGNSALVAAAKSKHWEMVKFLVESGASAEKYKGDDNSPLYLVAKEKKYSLLTTMFRNVERKEEQMYITITQCNDGLLIHVFEDAVPGFCRTQKGRDAATFLALNGKVDVLRAMLDRGADVDGVDNEGNTCLRSTARNGHANVMKLLLERRASVDLQHRRSGWTALHYASIKGHVNCICLLLKANASTRLLNNQGKNPIEVAKTDEIRRLLSSHSSQS